MVRTYYVEQYRNDDNMEDVSEWTLQDRKTKTEAEQCYTKSRKVTEIPSTIPHKVAD